MKAVVLVGGQGTRLRPLTETVKKELLPLGDRTILDQTLDRLVRHGVHDVLMSSPYLESTFHPFIETRRGDPRILWITEDHPLDTGGAIVNALEHLGDEPFFAMNGDILTDLDMSAMLTFHRRRGAAATIALHSVEDARAFGLVVTESEGRVLEFREKPEASIPGEINAGTYVLDPGVLRPWGRHEPISIERNIFPGLIDADLPVYGFLSDAYWRDLGTPQNYLQAHFDMLEGLVQGVSYPAPWVAAGADVDLRAHLGRWVAVNAGARIGPEAQIDDSVLHPDAIVEAGARVVGTIVGPGARVGASATVTGCVLGEGSWVPATATLADARVPARTEAVIASDTL